MTRCSTGRATQKYRGNGTDLSDILETPGDIIYADAAVSAENLVISGTTGDVLKVSASGIPEWGTSTSQWITSGDDIYYSLGHVGIGTTSPDANLHVTGNTFVSTDLALGGTLTMGNVLVEALHELSAITATGNVTPHVIEFTNPTTGLVTTGNVGIGTVTPLQTLEVNGSVGINHGGVGGYTFHTSTGLLRAGIHSTSGNHLLFKTGANNERMRLLTGGQLGIGTSTPGYTLDVAGDINFTGNLTQNGSAYGGGGSGSSPWTESGGNISRSTGNVSVGEQSSEQIVTQNYNSLTNIPASSRASGTWRNHTFGNITLPANWSNDNFQFKVTVNGTLDGVPTAEYVSITMKKQGSGTQPSVSLNFNPQNQSSGITSGGGNVYYTNVVNTNSTVSDGSFSAGDVVDIYMSIYVTYWASLSLAVEIRGGGTTSILFVDGTNDRVGIGLTQPTTALDVSGTVKATAFEGDGSALTGIVAGQWTESSGDIQRSSGNVEVGVANLFVNTTTSRVGIGTTSPDEILHLSSNDTNGAFLKVVGDTSNRAGIKLDEDAGDANIILEYDGNGSGAGNYFSIYSDVGGWIGKGGGFNYIPLNGRVGIGTNSPQGPLHVSSGTAGDCRLILQADTDNNDEGDNPRIEFWQDGAIQESAIGMTSNRLNLWNSVSSGSGIAFHTGTIDGWTNAIERMTITSTGSVGINQTSPNYTLDVTGDINFTGEIRKGGVVQSFGGGGSGSSPWVTSGNDISYTTGKVGVGTSSPIETLDVYGGFLVRPERTTKAYLNAWSRPTSGTFDSGSPVTGPTINVMYSKNAIYTTTGGLKVSPPNTDTEYFYVTASYYNYGFNIYLHSPAMNSTTSPYLSGDVFSSTRFKADNTEDFTGFAIGQDYQAGNALNDYSQSLDIARAHSAHMYFKTASLDGSLTEKMRITNTGNVGIGTSTPNYTLDVAGDLTCSGTMRHRAFAFYARASGGQIVANNGILSDSNSTITTEFDYTPAGTASSNGFRSSGGASNNQGTYFAPVDGIYHVSCKVRLSDSNTAQQEIQWYIKRTNGNEDQWESFEMWISPADGGGRRATMSSTIVKLAKDEGIFPRADNPTTSLSSATFGGHFLGTY